MKKRFEAGSCDVDRQESSRNSKFRRKKETKIIDGAN
jgi:hypothetical protein